ncbi:hypothetical protein A6F68_02005 [Tsuneonella dongtanensis]|uniref:DUF2855 domain-containing protein n=1 Tax=Tsuneonella dongtanensis TaxID=692370 RepID=A0A1B2AEE2_9SPHN|nr:DUF2855 family protein [Tsuneonella dongtanensis]ANY20513.1 hypothetical protein A6F68_02005 [Tsuneonella dongtanensis]
MLRQVLLEKANLAHAEIVEAAMPALADGAVRLAIESFSVTSNNVTYAAMGDAFRYWNFFPAPEGYGIVPMWGHAWVIESRCPDIAVGERVYGYLPMATHLDVIPGKVSPSGFTDTAGHRQPMSPVYNQYARLAADPEHDPSREAERMVFGPLFKTGFLIESFMRREAWFGAEQVILTSASSKTALSLASVARHRSPEVARIGLTSASNVDFVSSTGLYDRVIAYDTIDELPKVPSVSVDFAGNADVLRAIHTHLESGLRYSCLVGATHLDARTGATADLPGPSPQLFFAPDHAVALFKEVGPAMASQQIAESMHRFLSDTAGTVEIERRRGLEAARDVFVEMLGGSVDPKVGIVIEP